MDVCNIISLHSNIVLQIATKLRMYMFYFVEKVFVLSSLLLFPPGDATVYQLLHRPINRQVANRVAKNDVNFALPPTFRYVSIESP
ncbi:hypothetical protein TNCV_1611881 [Trichonephila clavipes]|nr:hypothetical protein TNCV_1611881 [Trichonephila clavipes]